MKKYRLAVLHSYPVQYSVPLWRKLSEHPQIDLTVCFCSDYGVEEKMDLRIGKEIKWDIPLLDGYRYKFLKNYARKPSLFTLFGLVNPGIATELWRKDYDALLVHGYRYITYLIAIIVARLKRIPILYRTEASLYYDNHVKRPMIIKILKRLIFGILFKNMSGFLAIGSRNKEFYEAYGIPIDKIFDCPYAIDNGRFIRMSNLSVSEKRNIREKFGINPNATVILFASRLVDVKRPMDALLAYEELTKTSDNIALLLVGDGPLRTELEAYIADKKIPNVCFLGFQNQSNMPKIYGISDIFVRTDETGKGDWGITINEAMACGCAIISSDSIGAADDLVHTRKNGYTFRCGDIKTLTSLLHSLIEHPEKRISMGRRSQEIIKEWNHDQGVIGILNALKMVNGKDKEDE